MHAAPSPPLPISPCPSVGGGALRPLDAQLLGKTQLVAWILGHAVDSAASGNFRHRKEILALVMVVVEQAVINRGDWTLAFIFRKGR